jgi:chemotaxis protein histidine kinase CheA
MPMTSDTSALNTHTTINVATALSDRYLLTAVGKYTLVFPAIWVSEILRIDRHKILQMPHYSPAILGIAHSQNSFLTLLAGWQFLPVNQPSRADQFTVVRLGGTMPEWQNVGVTVDRVLGGTVKESFPPIEQRDFFVVATAQLLPTDLWRPFSNDHHQ